MVKIEPPAPLEPPTKLDFLEYLEESHFYALENETTEYRDYLYDNILYNNQTFEFIEEYFDGDWRKGQEVHKVVITQRLYQITPDATQA